MFFHDYAEYNKDLDAYENECPYCKNVVVLSGKYVRENPLSATEYAQSIQCLGDCIRHLPGE